LFAILASSSLLETKTIIHQHLIYSNAY